MADFKEAAVIERRITEQLKNIQRIMPNVRNYTESIARTGDRAKCAALENELVTLENYLEGIRREMDRLRNLIRIR